LRFGLDFIFDLIEVLPYVSREFHSTSKMTVATAISVRPLAVPPTSSVDFGAEIHNANLDPLSGKHYTVFRTGRDSPSVSLEASFSIAACRLLDIHGIVLPWKGFVFSVSYAI